MRRIFRRMFPFGRKRHWYHTWDRAHLTAAERHELRRR